MIKIFSIITLILFVLTIGCGFAIHYGGETFKNAIGGHMFLGILTVISLIFLIILIFKLL